MTVLQRLMYATIQVVVACAVCVSNFVFYEPEDRADPAPMTSDFIDDTDYYNERVLKQFFPYEDVVYSLDVPLNMSYTTADFQKFKGTYLESHDAVSTDYFKRILFAGDSITYHLGMPERALSKYMVVAWSGLMVTNYADYKTYAVYNQSDVKKSSIKWISELKPDIIYVNLGTNGISIYTNDNHIKYYEKLLDRIAEASPKSVIVLVSAPPWGLQAQSITSTDISVLNKKLDHFNMYLLELAYSRGYYFLNASEALKDAFGNLNPKYCASETDGIHWSAAGRDAYIKYILEHPIPGY